MVLRGDRVEENMENNVDSAQYFADMLAAVPYPSRVLKITPKRSDFKTAREFHNACADAEEKYEREVHERREKLEEYRKRENEIDIQFWVWAMKMADLDDMPQSVKSVAKEYAYQEGHPGGYNDMFSVLLDISDIIINVWKAAKSE